MPKRKKGKSIKTLPHPQDQTLTLDPPIHTTTTMTIDSQSPETLASSQTLAPDQDQEQAQDPPQNQDLPQDGPLSPPPPSTPHVLTVSESPVPTVTSSIPVLESPAPIKPSSPAPTPVVNVTESPAVVPASRKPPVGKRKKFHKVKKLAAIEEKIALLHGSLHPVPFAPSSSLDFSRHERLFRTIGLWDFANLGLDRDPLRSDLLFALIAGYNQQGRCSHIYDARIGVSRADLGRALVLPGKPLRDKPPPSEEDMALFAEAESVAALAGFISNWMVVLEDVGVLPEEVVQAEKLVREGHPYKVDWSGLMWTMVEKELQEASKLEQCYYASHLQRLIRYQKPELFEIGAKRRNGKEPEQPEPSTEIVQAEEEAEVGDSSCAAKTSGLEDNEDTGRDDNLGPGLSLGLGSELDTVVALEESKGQEEGWHADAKDVGVSYCLQRCSIGDATAMECGELVKEGDEQGERASERFDDELAAKFSSLEHLTSADLLQAMEMGNGSYGMPVQPLDPSSGDFLAMGNETHKSMELDPGPAGPYLFGNSCKREIDDEDNVDNAHRLSRGDQVKRLRTDVEPWEHTPDPYDACMEQAEYWMSKAKTVVVEKENAYSNIQAELQYMNNMLQEKDQIIQTLEKARMEDAKKRELEACRLEHELMVMASAVHGYKRALKEARNEFAMYRKQFPQGDEPLYRDVEGTAGIVLSISELKKQQLEKVEVCRIALAMQLEKDEEMRRVAVDLINAFENKWFEKITGYGQSITNFAIKLRNIKGECNLLLEKLTKAKASEDTVE